jgi:Zn-dependent protease with chaperone function
MRCSRVAVLAAVLSLAGAGCATLVGVDDLQRMSRQSGGQMQVVRRADFPTGDPSEGTRGAPGSQLLSAAVSRNQAVASVVAAHGIPDAIAVAPPYATQVQLAYARDARLYAIAAQGFWIRRWVVRDRSLTDDELALVDPERRTAAQAEALRGLVAAHARVQTVGRALLEQLPPQGAAGTSYGMLLLNATPTTVTVYGGEPTDEEKIVAWVDPAGPQAGRLQVGDRVTAINGVSPRAADATGLKLDGSPRVTIARGGQVREVALQAESLPRRITFVVIPQEVPNAAAVDGSVGVTTGFLEQFPDDDVLAVAMGHEVAHITLGHVEPRVTPGSVLKGIVGVGVLLPAEIALPGSGQLLGGVVQGVENHFSRDQERDADRLGLHYARAAGYDPAAALTLIDTLQTQMPSGSVQQFLDIHPPYPERRGLIEQELRTLR